VIVVQHLLKSFQRAVIPQLSTPGTSALTFSSVPGQEYFLE
jgi:hypothetical protein